MRWNPLLGEWVLTATHRQDRTFLPPKDFCPLCPTKPGGFPTEIAEPDYDIVVFENRFPSMRPKPEPPVIAGTDLFPVRPSHGVCEVVVYTPHHSSTLAAEPVEQIDKLVRVWTDRYRELGAKEFVDYVFIFENKGEAIGVTLLHPHGQIYAYPFIPPVVETELAQSLAHEVKTGRCLLCDIVEEERRIALRMVYENDAFSAYAPFAARFPYEVHIASRRHLGALTELTRDEQRRLAEAIKSVIAAYDRVFDVSFPYMMLVHQRPTDGRPHGHYHFHIEFLPLLRSATKQKYLAGSESGAGVFITDLLPESTAERLRSLVTPVVWQHGSSNG
jgi:UDPglucose--hexose-1-phosphate uridylyltransferase